MSSAWLEWVNALLRWIHVIAGIMWIGDSLLFMWIDSHLHPDPQSRKDVDGVTWLLHGGGYYQLGEETESPGTGRNFEGGAFGGQAFGLGEWDLTSTTSIGLDVGYRWASVDVSKVNRQPPPIEIDVDYSGLHTRLVLRFHPRGAR